MPLGIEQNNLAPQLIANSGAALVQGIRQIGQQISGHLTEIQTKRDLGAMAQDLEGLNVQSDEFPLQLIQISTRHPLAARDERGQMAMSILGKAHGQWQAGEAEARAFNRAMAMQGMRTRDARTLAQEDEDRRSKRPVVVNGQLIQPDEIDETGYATALTPPPVGRGSTAMPFRSTPSGIMDARTGLDPQGNPLPTGPVQKPLTTNQLEIQKRAATQRKIEVAKTKLSQARDDIKTLEKRYLDLDKEEAKLNPKDENDAPRLQKIYDYRKEVGTRLEELGKQRQQLEQDFEMATNGVEELPPVPAGAAASSDALIPVTGPDAITVKIKRDPKTGKRYELDINTNQIIREVP